MITEDTKAAGFGMDRDLPDFGQNRDYVEERDRILRRRRGSRGGPLDRAGGSILRGSERSCSGHEGSILFKKDWTWDITFGGMIVEHINELVRAANDELKESKETLQKMYNDIRSLSDVVQPALIDHVKELRSARMSAVAEVSETIKSLKEVRKFFFESDYHEEISRLRTFVALCKEIKQLKEDGTLDAVCDAAIRLAVKEESR